ncbi:MAG: TonB-dependent receptor, partial [Sphingobium sp.]
PGIFGQVEREFTPRLTLATSTRIDVHNRYGTQFSPRLSLLYRPDLWTIRLSGGHGYYAPTPFVEEIEAAGLSRLAPLADIKAETADTASIDIGYKSRGFEANVTAFGSNTRNMTKLRPVMGQSGQFDRVQFINVPGIARIRGLELLLRYRWKSFMVTGSYVHLNATEPAEEGRRTIPLTPKDTAGMVAMWEAHDKGRVGLEVYYTGRQALDDNPFRAVSRPYFDIGMMAEVVLGRARLFVNAENILGIRQTGYDPLIRPNRAPEGQWTVDVWAPTDGFVLNAGIRMRFGGKH